MDTSLSNKSSLSGILSNIGVEVKVDIPIENYVFLSIAIMLPILLWFVLNRVEQ